MLLAVVVTLFDRDIVDFEYIIAGIVVGAAIGAVLARTIKLTAMPQLVAIFNGFGGAASAVVAASELNRLVDESADIPPGRLHNHHARDSHRDSHLLRQHNRLR